MYNIGGGIFTYIERLQPQVQSTHWSSRRFRVLCGVRIILGKI